MVNNSVDINEVKITSVFAAGGIFTKRNTKKNNSNKKNSPYNQKSGIKIYKHCFCHFNYLLSSHTAASKKRIAKSMSYVKNNTFPGAFNDIKFGRMITTPKNPAAIFVQNPDKTLNQDFLALNNLFAENFITITISQ